MLSPLLVNIDKYFGEVTPLLSLAIFGMDFSGSTDFRGLPRGRRAADVSGRFAPGCLPSPSSCELFEGLSLLSPSLIEHFGEVIFANGIDFTGTLDFGCLPLGFDARCPMISTSSSSSCK